MWSVARYAGPVLRVLMCFVNFALACGGKGVTIDLSEEDEDLYGRHRMMRVLMSFL